MKKYYYVLSFVAIVASMVYTSCKKDEIDTSIPQISLPTDYVTGKSGQELTLTVDISAPNGISSLIITKGVNLKEDKTFGTNGVLKVTPTTTGAKTMQYTFKYTYRADEVDKLVGINFRVEDASGKASEKDLTINTTVSGAQLLYSYRWNIKSRMWILTPPVEDLKNCEKDDYFTFNADGTMAKHYGTNTGTGDCGFDGFNVYTSWSLSPDEKELTIKYASLFDPSQVTTEKYTVKSLTRDRMVLSITYDLTIFGLSDKELFEFTYDSSPK